MVESRLEDKAPTVGFRYDLFGFGGVPSQRLFAEDMLPASERGERDFLMNLFGVATMTASMPSRRVSSLQLPLEAAPEGLAQRQRLPFVDIADHFERAMSGRARRSLPPVFSRSILRRQFLS